MVYGIGKRHDDSEEYVYEGAGEGARFSAEKYIENGTVKIVSAVHIKANDRIEVRVAASRILLGSEMAAFNAATKRMLAPREAECLFDFEAPVAAIQSGAADGCDELLEAWCEFSPQLEPMLRACRIERHGNEYVFFTHPRYLLALTQTTAGEFRSHIAEKYSWNAAIRLEGDERMADGLDGAEPVVKRDWGAGKLVQKSKRPQKKKLRRLAPTDIVYGKEVPRPDIIRMCDLDDKSGRVTVKGQIIGFEVFVSQRWGSTVLTLSLTDKTNTVLVKVFPDALTKGRTVTLIEKAKKEGALLLIRGSYRFDNYARDYCLFADDINRYPAEERTDESPDKRVELHLHTKMSAMDATTELSEVVARAAKWGHKAIAITDHGVVHAFPEAKKAAKEHNIKVIFGCEGYLVPDCEFITQDEKRVYAALAAVCIGSGAHTRVFELAAVRFEAGGIVDSFTTPVNPGIPQPKRIAELTGYSDEQIDTAPVLNEAVRMLEEFISGAQLVVHGAETLAAIHSLIGPRCTLATHGIDSAMLTQYLKRELKKDERRMPELSAADGATWTAENMLDIMKRAREAGVMTLPVVELIEAEPQKRRSNHIILLAATQPGLKNLYKLVSYSNLEHFYKTPRIPKSLLSFHRDGIIVGSACEAGELFRAVVEGKSEEEIENIARFYDYLEIQPIGNNRFLIREGLAKDDEALRDFNRRIVELGEKLDKPVVATGDVHFLEPEDSIFRAILMTAMSFKDADQQPPLYFRTTEDMLAEFNYLGSEKAFEVVVENTNKIAEMCEQLRPFLDEKQTYAPELPGAADDLRELSVTKAHELYGDPLPETVQKRLDKELNSIIGNGYSSLYMVAKKLVSKSLDDGYLVGSRGSVGSSLVAYLAGITEVNALPAHYRCKNCKYTEFPDVGDSSRCGIDLPAKECPNCGAELVRDGYEIPFETFLGFKGDKTPDIDLNFSGEYQPVAHKFTEEMFGEGHAFRAGTISGVKEKTAYGYVLSYCEKRGMHPSEVERNRLAAGCVGTRRTTGQHPGGIVIVPEDLEIYDFCPVQHPAEKVDADSITTHFDFHALDDKLVKLDILGHDDPTTLRMLYDITGLNPKDIPLDDKSTMRLFRTDSPLGVSLEELGCDVGSLGIPEFGTNFVRGMLMNTRPTTMEELVRIAGLSHGTDVWLNNAEELVKDGTATLMEVICTRDDIMNYLIAHGGEPSLSFKTMESVRKGKGLKPEMEEAMKANGVPQWYIESCKKIKYMFPRAHAAAYVMMSFRVAYYKVHHPLAFYTAYFTVRADTFDVEQCLGGKDKVLENIRRLKSLDQLDPKQEDQLIILEIVYEMNLRGLELLPVDIYKSRASRFEIENGRIRPPFNSIAGLGSSASRLIEEAARERPFLSREDFIKRTKINSGIIEKLDRLGCLDELPESDQVSMFGDKPDPAAFLNNAR